MSMQTVLAQYLSSTSSDKASVGAASPIRESTRPDYESMSPQALARLMVFGTTASGAALFDMTIVTQITV